MLVVLSFNRSTRVHITHAGHAQLTGRMRLSRHPVMIQSVNGSVIPGIQQPDVEEGQQLRVALPYRVTERHQKNRRRSDQVEAWIANGPGRSSNAASSSKKTPTSSPSPRPMKTCVAIPGRRGHIVSSATVLRGPTTDGIRTPPAKPLSHVEIGLQYPRPVRVVRVVDEHEAVMFFRNARSVPLLRLA